MSEQLHYHQPAGHHVAMCTLRPEVNAQGEAYLRGFNGAHMYLVTPVRNPVPGGPTHVLIMCSSLRRGRQGASPTLPPEAFADAGAVA